MTRSVRSIIACSVITLLMTGCMAIPQPQPFMVGAETIKPKGAFLYKGPLPEEIKEPSPYSEDLLQALATRMHKEFKYESEEVEDWTPSLKGDCDSFATYAHLELAKMGIPSRLVYARTSSGLHLVTEVDGWIIDNTSPWVKPKDWLNYEWISIGTLNGAWFDLRPNNPTAPSGHAASR